MLSLQTYHGMIPWQVIAETLACVCVHAAKGSECTRCLRAYAMCRCSTVYKNCTQCRAAGRTFHRDMAIIHELGNGALGLDGDAL